MSRLARLALATLLPALLALAGCGVPTSGTARPVPSDAVPFGLLDSRAAAPPAPHAASSRSGVAGVPTVYFLRKDKLVGTPVSRVPDDIRAALVQLVATLSGGPTSEQRAAGLGTALPPALHLAVRDLTSGGVATIDLQGQDVAKVGDQGPLAVGQVVLTAASLPGVASVRLTRQGTPMQAQLVGGELTASPLTPDEYASLVAPK